MLKMSFSNLCVCVLISGLFGTDKCMRIDVASVARKEWNLTEEIRCYCNLPECITTSYMCKSQGLGCFSDIVAFSDVNRAKHGCLDLLESERQDQCQNEPSAKVSHPRSLLLCCHQDLCNHVDRPDTFLASSLMNISERGFNKISNYKQTAGYNNAEVWFRAATIAVPICGIMILFVLIALAIRILRSDTIDDRVLAAKLRAKHSAFSTVSLNGPSIVHQFHLPHPNEINGNISQKKMPLLFQHNDSTNSTYPNSCINRPTNHGQGVNVLHSCHQKQKNETNAKLNLSQNTTDNVPIVPVHPTSQESQPNLIDFHKSSNPTNNNYNLFQQEQNPFESQSTCALLSSVPIPVNSKLTYKKPFVVNWTDTDINSSNSK